MVQIEAFSTTECHDGDQSQGGHPREKYRLVHQVQEEHYEGHHEPCAINHEPNHEPNHEKNHEP